MISRPAAPSAFYLRKRRLAIVFAALSVSLLLASTLVGRSIEHYDRPRLAVEGDRLRFVWTCNSGSDDGAGMGRLETDLELVPAGPVVRRGIEATAVLPDDGGDLYFHGPHYSVLKGDSSGLSGISHGKPWAVAAAVRQPPPGTGWIFGHHEGKVVARRRALRTFSDVLTVADSRTVERITACVDGAAGPLVAWLERGTSTVKTALFDGQGFVPRAEFRLPEGALWDVALSGPRVLLATYERADRSFSQVGLRLRCCEGCPAPRAPSILRFEDPHFFLGKVVTGVAVAAAGDVLAVGLTRFAVVQGATAPIDGPGGTLRILHQEPSWRMLAGLLIPMSTLFLSFSLVFLGYTMLTDRGQFILEKLTPASTQGPVPAEILQRAMAFLLDFMIVLPILLVLSETLDLSPDRMPDPMEGAFWALSAWMAGLMGLYGLLLEGLLGWTPGKKIVGLKVVRLDGAPLTLSGAILRNLARPLESFFPVGPFLGMSVIMATRRRQRLGDLLAGTMVVEDRPAEAPAAEAQRELAETRRP